MLRIRRRLPPVYYACDDLHAGPVHGLFAEFDGSDDGHRLVSRLVDGALSHDHITRWLSSAAWHSADIWRQAKPLIRQAEAQRPAEEFAVLVVDDSILEKAHTDANELICTHWDHSQQRYVKGLHFVSLLYQARELALPLAVELVRKTVPVDHPKTRETSYQSPFTKNEYLQQMLRVAQQQVAYRYLLADSWYASAENRSLVRALGHHCVFALESSRTVALNEGARAQGQFRPSSRWTFPLRSPCESICGPSKRRYSLLDKSLQTRTAARASGIWSAATPTGHRPN